MPDHRDQSYAEVVIIGAGPAGLAAAIQLQRNLFHRPILRLVKD